VQLKYVVNPAVQPEKVASLRESVGWDNRLAQLKETIGSTYLIIACFHDVNLVGFVDVISDGVDDALIRNLMVHPDYCGKGIALNLLKYTAERLSEDRIKTVNVLFEPELADLYQKAGFNIICGGIIDNEEGES